MYGWSRAKFSGGSFCFFFLWGHSIVVIVLCFFFVSCVFFFFFFPFRSFFHPLRGKADEKPRFLDERIQDFASLIYRARFKEGKDGHEEKACARRVTEEYF